LAVQNHRHILPGRAQAPQDGKAVLIGQHQVEHQQVEAAAQALSKAVATARTRNPARRVAAAVRAGASSSMMRMRCGLAGGIIERMAQAENYREPQD
jgi:hypothetical protein